MITDKTKPIFIFIVISAALLRLWGINFGLPYQFHQDEPIVVNHALAYGTGDLNPHFFAIPPLTSYILFIIYGIYFLVTRLLGLFPTAEDFALSFFKDPTVFYILGRIFIGVIPGILSVITAHNLYKRIFTSKKAALFAASVLAFGFINVSDSHYIYTDMLFLFFILLSLLKAAEIMDKPLMKNYIFAGAVIGIACGIKYNAAILVVSYLAAHLIAVRKNKATLMSLNFIIGLLMSTALFFLVNPFAFLDFKFFLASLMTQAKTESYIGWVHHIDYSLREGLGMIIVILGTAGILLSFIKDTYKAVFLYSFPVFFYMHLVFFSQPFPRYAIPLTPFLGIGAGYLIYEYIISRLKSSFAKKATFFLSVLLFIPLLLKSIKADMLFGSYDTRAEAADWIEANLKPNCKIAIDHTFFRPAILQCKEQLTEKYKIADRQKGLGDIKRRKLQFMLEANRDKKGYYLYFLSPSPKEEGQFFSTTPSLPFDYNLLKAEAVDYVVINYANRQKGNADFYKRLQGEGRLVVSFSPYEDGEVRFSYDSVATTCMPVVSKELYSRKRSGPAIEIYKIKR